MYYEKTCKYHLQHDEESDSVPNARIKSDRTDRGKRTDDIMRKVW